MMNLVGYASDSSADEDEVEQNDNESQNVITKDNAQPSIKLPSVSKPAKINVEQEDELEDFLKSRTWEKELAAEAKAGKDTIEKPATKSKNKPSVFGEFGALLSKPIVDDVVDEDEDEQDMSVTSSAPKQQERKANPSGSGLLKMLPQPNIKVTKTDKKFKAASVLIPQTLKPQQTTIKRPIKEDKPAVPEKRKNLESDDEDDDESTDFFGFNSAKADTNLPTSMPIPSSSSFLPPTQIYDDAPMPGPERPTAASNYAEVMDEDHSNKKMKMINNERAQKLIYDKELAPWGANDSVAREAVLNIREVNVDDELGPDVHQTLLRNLNNKAMAQSSAVPLPNMKKHPQDRMAKQKHQITYLAASAVAREEQLQEQWAAKKEQRLTTAKRYGFR